MKLHLPRTALLQLAAALSLTSVASLSMAQDVANGKALYESKFCVTCHLADIRRNRDGILAGANDPRRILSECANDRDMKPLCATGKQFAVSNAEAVDIAAYIASEANGTAQAPAVTLSATALTFSRTLGAGPSAPQNLKVTNSGTANLVLANVAVAGTNPGDYALAAPVAGARCQAGTTVAPKASCSVDLSFSPTAAGARKATLVITPNAASGLGASNVALNGTATADLAPVAKADVTDLDFGTQVLNAAAISKTVVISNAGDAALTLAAANALTLAGTNAADFALGNAGTCKNATSLAPAATCTVVLNFTAKAAGNRTGSLTVKSNAADLVVNLKGAALDVAGPVAAADLSTLDFGTQVLQTASAGKTVVLSNTGTANLVFDSANAFALSGADGQEFAIDASSTCSAATPVAVGASCTLVLTFTPGAAGGRVATLTVNSNAVTDVSVALSGTGQAAGGAAAAEEDAGGCSMADPKAARFDPVLGLLALAALAVLLGRRRRRIHSA